MSRLHCESESFKMDLILDVNIQIYPVDLGKYETDNNGRFVAIQAALRPQMLLLLVVFRRQVPVSHSQYFV